MMYKSLAKKVCYAALAGSYTFAAGITAAPLDLSDVPLVVAPPAPPNIMIMFDTSGSMEHVSPGLPYLATDTTSTWNTTTCENSSKLSAGTTVSLVIQSGYPLIRVGNTNYTWGPNTSNRTRIGGTNYDHRCFDNNATYQAKLTTFSASSTGDNATYSGHYLNYYFYLPVATYSTTGSWNGRQFHPNQKSRMQTGQTVINNFVDNQIDDSIYLGLTDFNVVGSVTSYNSRGAQLHEEVTLLDSNKKTAIKSRVSSLSAGGTTPLAESLAGIGRYFIGYGDNRTLTLHPSATTPTTSTANSVFPTANIVGANSLTPSPITSSQFCQKNFAIMMTDGRATHDQDIASELRDYDGDCTGSSDPSCGSGYDMKSSSFNDSSPSGYSYEGYQASDYLDDVAQALYEIDLRPDVDDLSGNEYLNNIVTYLIGFADIGVKNDQMFKDTALQGSGGARTTPFLPDNEDELTLAFEEIIADIFAQQGAFAAVSFNTGQLTNNSAVYQGRFSTKPWSGSLLAFGLNGTTGTINQPRLWDAGLLLDQLANPAATRNVITRNPASTSGTTDGLSVSTSTADWAALPAQLKNDLLQGVDADQDSITNEDDDAKMLLNYLLGDSSNEGAGITNYRIRDNNQRTAANAPQPNLPIRNRLGDIVNSAPIFVGAPELRWPEYSADNRFGASGPLGTYSSYQTAQAARTPMLYVGANDGMVHGFNATLSGASAGAEVIAYMPTQLFSSSPNQGLHYLANRNYLHKYYIDGTPIASDVYIDNGSGTAAWRTVLVGGFRGGARGLYALDVTNPGAFATPANESNIVLWEFSDTDDADLGYVYGKISVGMMQNGQWAAIFGNGYNSTGSGNASLFIVYIEQGADGTWVAGDYKKIDTGANVGSSPNGLSTPTPVDLDGDRVIDRIYAGDIEGNIWAFDVSGTADSAWGVDYGGPLFTACTSTPCSSTNRQAITAELSIVRNSATTGTGIDPDLLVLFGTGKYVENTDPEDTTLHSYYSIWDSGVGGFQKNNLEPRVLDDSQTINSNPVRFLSGSSFTYGATRKGWYFDFNTQSKERVISDSLTRNGITAFTTIIPNRVVCASGGSGSLMALDLVTGLASSAPLLDVDGDGDVDSGDTGSGGVPPAGKRLLGYLPSELNTRGGRVYFGTTGEDNSGGGGGGSGATVAGIADEKLGWPPGDSFEGRWTWEEAFRP